MKQPIPLCSGEAVGGVPEPAEPATGGAAEGAAERLCHGEAGPAAAVRVAQEPRPDTAPARAAGLGGQVREREMWW